MIGQTKTGVPFNKPYITGNEIEYLREAIANAHLSGDGPFTKRIHEWLEQRTMAQAAFLTHSCTAALEMSALLLDIQPGDEIIMPSYTFVSTANAFVLRGGVPVFVDVRADTLNLDEALVERAITPKTRAIAAVHYAGVACEMDELVRIARERNIALVEDAAQALGSTYRGKPLGSMGSLAALSFHETKNVISGEGGALLVNDPELIERAEIIREKGTNRSNFLRGNVNKYRWVDIGSSYLPSEIIAAFLWAQLEAADDLLERRLALWNAYHARMEPLERAGKLRRPIVPAEIEHNAHLYYVLVPDAATRTRVLAELKAEGIGGLFHYVPLHSAPAGERFGRTHGVLANTDGLSARLIRLPMFYEMDMQDVDRVCTILERAITAS
ncbi:MAG TPA: dTDP-4-amino-4,6-dideoxygalactose transaminase [Candidatus Baltobacteraceae bacterium]|nr:dTDP-4-amino-4,6-dideoxygalactose transaminase [Candidatus Baltobacteraceae bacterium]